jgi:hypothetical protein
MAELDSASGQRRMRQADVVDAEVEDHLTAAPHIRRAGVTPALGETRNSPAQ